MHVGLLSRKFHSFVFCLEVKTIVWSSKHSYACVFFTTVIFVFSQGNFFQNIGSIILFAVMGTAVSTCIVGGGLYGLSQLGVIFSLNLVQRSIDPSLYVQPLPLTHLYSVPAFRSCYL